MMQSEWGWTVIVDLFMSGLGGCLFLTVAALFLVEEDRFRTAVRIGAWTSFAAVLVGVCCLLADVGQPLRAMWMFDAFVNFDSWMPRGAWSLALTLVVFLLFALLGEARVVKLTGRERSCLIARKVLAVSGIACGLFVTVYTGCLLMDSGSIPFWETPFVPLSFMCSSLAAGAATALMLVVLTSRPAEHGRVCVALALTSVLSAVFSAAFVVAIIEGASNAETSRASVSWTLQSPAFALGAVCLGALVVAGLVVLACSRRPAVLRYLAVGGCVCALVAGFSLRFWVVGAGAHEELPSIGVTQLFEGDAFRFQ